MSIPASCIHHLAALPQQTPTTTLCPFRAGVKTTLHCVHGCEQSCHACYPRMNAARTGSRIALLLIAWAQSLYYWQVPTKGRGKQTEAMRRRPRQSVSGIRQAYKTVLGVGTRTDAEINRIQWVLLSSTKNRFKVGMPMPEVLPRQEGADSAQRTLGFCFSVYRSRLKCHNHQCPTLAHSFRGDPMKVVKSVLCTDPHFSISAFPTGCHAVSSTSLLTASNQ